MGSTTQYLAGVDTRSASKAIWSGFRATAYRCRHGSGTRLSPPALHSHNPCRAGIVADAVEAAASWTSHRAYLGLEKPPPGLRVDLGLELCGFDMSAESRLGFDEVVRARRHDARDPELSDEYARRMRTEIRRKLAAPVEVSAAILTSEGLNRHVVVRGSVAIRDYCDLGVDEVLQATKQYTGIPIGLLTSRNRERRVSNARRLALMVWSKLGLSIKDMCNALCLSSSAGSNLLYLRPEKNSQWDDAVAAIIEQLSQH